MVCKPGKKRRATHRPRLVGIKSVTRGRLRYSPTGARMLLYVDANFASPYALVAFVSLIEKGLEFEIETLDLATHANRDPNFARTSITRRIPTLIHDGFALSESSAICEYIDETFPG